MPDATNEPTENALINEPYERIDRLNYKDRADRNVDHGDELYTRRSNEAADAHAFANQTQAAIIQQQREGIEDVRSQRDQLFAQFLQLNATSIDLSRSLTANSADLARRTAADGQTMSVAYLEPTGTDENISSTIGAQASTAAGKAVADLAPEINNSIKAAVAESAQNTVGATGQAAYGASTAQVIAEMNAAMNQSNQIMANLATAVEVLSAKITK